MSSLLRRLLREAQLEFDFDALQTGRKSQHIRPRLSTAEILRQRHRQLSPEELEAQAEQRKKQEEAEKARIADLDNQEETKVNKYRRPRGNR